MLGTALLLWFVVVFILAIVLLVIVAATAVVLVFPIFLFYGIAIIVIVIVIATVIVVVIVIVITCCSWSHRHPFCHLNHCCCCCCSCYCCCLVLLPANIKVHSKHFVLAKVFCWARAFFFLKEQNNFVNFLLRFSYTWNVFFSQDLRVNLIHSRNSSTLHIYVPGPMYLFHTCCVCMNKAKCWIIYFWMMINRWHWHNGCWMHIVVFKEETLIVLVLHYAHRAIENK